MLFVNCIIKQKTVLHSRLKQGSWWLKSLHCLWQRCTVYKLQNVLSPGTFFHTFFILTIQSDTDGAAVQNKKRALRGDSDYGSLVPGELFSCNCWFSGISITTVSGAYLECCGKKITRKKDKLPTSSSSADKMPRQWERSEENIKAACKWQIW